MSRHCFACVLSYSIQCSAALDFSLQIYTDVIKSNHIPPSIDPSQLAKIVKISDCFHSRGTDVMGRFLEVMAKEVSGLLCVFDRKRLRVTSIVSCLPRSVFQLKQSAFKIISAEK